MAFRFRRGTDLERQSITPRLGEPLYVTDTGKLYIGDGTTQGGNLVSISVLDDDTPSLGGNLDLAGNNIIGTGNIDIDGYINATGNINLGDGAEDNVIIGGVISSSLIPSDDRTYDLGTSTFAWNNGFFEGLDVDGEISANSLSVNNIYSPDSASIYDATTDTFFGNLQGDVAGSIISDDSTVVLDHVTRSLTGDVTGNVTGDVTGDVFGVDETLLIDSLSNTFVGSIETTEPIIANLNQSTLQTNNGIEFKMLRGSFAAPTEPDNFDRTNIIWQSYDAISGDYQDDAAIIGYHQSGGGGYIGISPVDASYNFFNTAIELDGKSGIISIAGETNINGAISVSNGITGDLTGSLFSDTSSMLIDGVNGRLIAANLDIIGTTSTTPTDTQTVNSWLEVTVNNNTRYIPLYT